MKDEFFCEILLSFFLTCGFRTKLSIFKLKLQAGGGAGEDGAFAVFLSFLFCFR